MPRWVREAVLLAPVLGVAGLLRAWTASATFPVGGPATWTALVDALAALVAAAWSVRAARIATDPRDRAAWLLRAAGCALWVLAPLDWALGRVHGGLGLADLGRAGYLAGVTAGVVLKARAPDNRTRGRMVLDGAAVAAVVFTGIWALVGDRIWASAHSAPLVTATHVALPFAAVVLLIFYLLLTLTEFLPGTRGVPVLYLAGLAGVAVADLRYVHLCAFGHEPDVVVDSGGWLVGFLLLARAAWAYEGVTPRRSEAFTSPGVAYLPYGVVIVMSATLVTQTATIGRVPLPEVVAACLVVLIVLGRQVLLLAQNRALVADLADRERELIHRARHDSLTGVGNRALLMERLPEALAGQEPLSLLLCDLDDFKGINDTFGHHAGDEMLVQVADRLLAVSREQDTVARLGGDEFAIVLLCDGDEAVRIARNLRQAFAEPFHVAGHRLALSASIGVVTLDDGDRSITAAELLRGADIAMYEAKRRGKNDVQVFTPELRPEGPAPLRLREELATALDRGDVTVVYQPLATAADGRVVAVEALVRWEHPVLGAIPPHECVAAAGRGELVSRLTDTVLTAVGADLLRWAARPEAAGLGVSVNLSAAQLADPGLPDRLRGILDLTSQEGEGPGHRLTVEVTEPGVLQDLDAAARRLTEIRALGCSVTLDGFGSGHCALTPLTGLPVDQVKIDLAALRDLDRFERLVAAVRAVTRGRGVRTIAEGVETAEQWDAARRAGCDLIQGYVLSRPVPAAQVPPLLRQAPAVPGRQRGVVSDRTGGAPA